MRNNELGFLLLTAVLMPVAGAAASAQTQNDFGTRTSLQVTGVLEKTDGGVSPYAMAGAEHRPSENVSAADGTIIEEGVNDSHPGDVVPEEVVMRIGEDSFFCVNEIPDDIFRLMQGKSYKPECTVPRDSLRYIRCLHRDKDGAIRVGEMVLHRRIAADMLEIFRELYRQRYPIERMRLIDYWDADDEMSMRDNNSSSFNFRFISHSKKVSIHGLGLAVDINPLYNPYHKRLADGTEVIEPATGAPYLDRSKDFPYKIVEGDLCWRLFTEHGFEWGGSWTGSKDWQHFEIRP